MATRTLIEQKEPVTRLLTASDRCDRCTAKAWVRVTMPSGVLYFCGHHANAHIDALKENALEILDERHLLFEEEMGLG